MEFVHCFVTILSEWTDDFPFVMQDSADLVDKFRNFARQNKGSGIWGEVFQERQPTYVLLKN